MGNGLTGARQLGDVTGRFPVPNPNNASTTSSGLRTKHDVNDRPPEQDFFSVANASLSDVSTTQAFSPEPLTDVPATPPERENSATSSSMTSTGHVTRNEMTRELQKIQKMFNSLKKENQKLKTENRQLRGGEDMVESIPGDDSDDDDDVNRVQTLLAEVNDLKRTVENLKNNAENFRKQEENIQSLQAKVDTCSSRIDTVLSEFPAQVEHSLKLYVQEKLNSVSNEVCLFHEEVKKESSFIREEVKKETNLIREEMEEETNSIRAEVKKETILMRNDVGKVKKETLELLDQNSAAFREQIGSVQTKVEDLQKSLALLNNRFAFNAVLWNDVTTNMQKKVIIFDRVLLNIGDAYSSRTGTFTAPVSGIYVFVATVNPNSAAGLAWAGMYTGRTRISYMRCEGANSSCTGHAVERLTKGQEVCVRSYKDKLYRFAGEGFCRFSGYLLLADADVV